jgi:muramidase (phage lysozyme)
MTAFLDVISFAEGTNKYGDDDGYNVVVGGFLFSDYSRHPKRYVRLEKLKITSSAAGRYQVLGWVADHYILTLNLPDFGPESQDRIALQLIRECKAYSDIEAGFIRIAIRKCSSRWASFPGNDYGQRKESIDKMLAVYLEKGGSLNGAL